MPALHLHGAQCFVHVRDVSPESCFNVSNLIKNTQPLMVKCQNNSSCLVSESFQLQKLNVVQEFIEEALPIERS